MRGDQKMLGSPLTPIPGHIVGSGHAEDWMLFPPRVPLESEMMDIGEIGDKVEANLLQGGSTGHFGEYVEPDKDNLGDGIEATWPAMMAITKYALREKTAATEATDSRTR